MYERAVMLSELGPIIRNKRLELGLTRKNVSNQLGISVAMIGRLECFPEFADMVTFIRVAQYLGTTPSALLQESELSSGHALRDADQPAEIFTTHWQTKKVLSKCRATRAISEQLRRTSKSIRENCVKLLKVKQENAGRSMLLPEPTLFERK